MKKEKHHSGLRLEAALPYRVLFAIILLLFGLFCLIPFLMVISVSLTPQNLIDENGYHLLPQALTTEAYRFIFTYPGRILQAYGVSIFITVVGTVLNVIISAMLAYPLSRMEFRYRSAVSLFVFITMVFGGGTVPYYILIKQYLHMDDKIWVLIIPQLVVASNVFLLRIFMQGIPQEIYESASLDGASEFRIFRSIVLPLVKPGLATIGLFTALMYWNEVITGKLFITNEKLLPLQNLLDQYTQYITYIMTNGGSSGGLALTNIPTDGILFAMCLVAAGPMVVVFLFFQKYFVAGLTMGAVKN